MANTHDVGKYFWHYLKYPVKPRVLVDPAETQEIEEPYRRGRGFALRLPFTRHALVVGQWLSAHNESEALTYAVAGRPMGYDELDWDSVRFGEQES